MKKTALLSVYDKTGIANFAKELVELDWEIYASGGTAKELKNAGIGVKDVADLVGGSAILGHKVVTLSREIHAGLLASDEEQKELDELGIPRIDLVCVDLYPLEETIASAQDDEQAVINQTDIGGPTMLRAAAKGRRIVISQAEQRARVLQWLKDGMPDEKIHRDKMAAKAEAVAASYALASAQYISRDHEHSWGGEVTRKAAPAVYGENRWQPIAWLESVLSDDELAIDNFEQIEGAALSYNNYCDVDRLLQTTTHIAAGWDVNFGKTSHIVVGGKHGNACGAAVKDSPADAIKSALEGDLRAIFGGSIMVNFAINEELAELLVHHKVEKGRRLLDVIVAPAIDEAARDILSRKKGKCRLLINPALENLDKNTLDTEPRYRYVRGGGLVQNNYDFILNLEDEELDKQGEANAEDVVLGWAVGSTCNSNTITLTKDGQLIGNGVGQQDRVGAAELAIKRATDAGHDVKSSVAYSDSFFPFADGPLILAEAGVKSIFATSGSVGDDKVKSALQEKQVAFWTLPDAKARGFYAH